MVTEHDSEFEPWPGEVNDPIRAAIGNLLVAIIESTNADSPERARAMNEALEAHGRIRDAMCVRPRLN
jgi:hypothetical protein